jgi:2-polyprenyl-6-hydroxyphenyl methylase/3-demethylubiquinone-9 3-methyltransferase
VGATRVLDLGCGNGAFTAAIGAAGFAVSGCDSSASGIAIAQKAHPDIHFFSQDLCSPLEERHRGEYDAVISMEVIEHLPAPRVLMERALQALRRGGAFVLSTPFHGYWKNLALALTNQFDDHWPLRDFGHVKFFSRRTLVQLFQEYPFSVRTFLTVGRIPAFARSMILVGTKR